MLKKILIGMCCVMCLVFFAGCGNTGELTWNKSLQSRIKRDYKSHLFEKGYDEDFKVEVVDFYGIYNDSVVLIIRFPGASIRGIEEEIVAGRKFTYDPATRIQVWNDGNFFTLTQAFERELLTEADIETIYTTCYNI